MIDIDHFIEYAVHFGFKDLTYRNVYNMSERTNREGIDRGFSRLFLVLHMGEIAIVLWAVTRLTGNIYLLAVSVGYTFHLMLDCIGNHLNPLSYFLLWRIIHQFRTDRLMRKD